MNVVFQTNKYTYVVRFVCPVEFNCIVVNLRNILILIRLYRFNDYFTFSCISKNLKLRKQSCAFSLKPHYEHRYIVYGKQKLPASINFILDAFCVPFIYLLLINYLVNTFLFSVRALLPEF